MHNRICYQLRMRLLNGFACIAILLSATLTIRAQSNPDWTTPVPPFRIADNLYYVGTRDLAVYLVTTPAGNILINANLASSPPLIRHSIEQLGFRYADIKIVLNGQAHSDHVGGLAQILRETHARDFVMEYDADAVRTGGHADFAFGHDITTPFTPARVDRVLHDNDTVTLGGVTLTAHKTAGHTRGCTTWTFKVHVPGEPATQLRNVVIVGGLAALDQYQLIATPGHPESYPGIATDFENTFATLRKLPCDIFLGAHGLYFDLLPKLARLPKQGPTVFIDPTGYQAAINEAQQAFESKRAAQSEVASHHPNH
jgi:metallo-beta-lactamase class B